MDVEVVLVAGTDVAAFDVVRAAFALVAPRHRVLLCAPAG
jgi:hypothetical protein